MSRAPSVASATSHHITQPLRRVALRTSQALHLRHLARRPCLLKRLNGVLRTKIWFLMLFWHIIKKFEKWLILSLSRCSFVLLRRWFLMLVTDASTCLVIISPHRIFGCIPVGCVFLLLCNTRSFVKFIYLSITIYEFDE